MELLIGSICTIVFIGFLICFLQYSNHSVMLSEYSYGNEKVPNAFYGFKILHISDLHADLPKRKYDKILKMVHSAKPDVIVFTGDAIDYVHRKNFQRSISFVEEMAKNFQVYYVTGNHEYMHKECFPIIEAYENIDNVTVLHDKVTEFENGGQHIFLFGVDDPYVLYNGEVPSKYITPKAEFLEKFHGLFKVPQEFSVLLSHRPEFFEEYVKEGFDLVFTGHAHGGQWWVPFAGGFLAPDQGVFPKFVRGRYVKDKTTMFVSRGLGNSVVPFRLFNRPELLVVTLQGEVK